MVDPELSSPENPNLSLDHVNSDSSKSSNPNVPFPKRVENGSLMLREVFESPISVYLAVC